MLEQSLWRAQALPDLPSRPLPDEVDVVVIGGGITGLTTAYLLTRSGKRVAVFDRERIGSGETGNTSAHLTYSSYILGARLPSDSIAPGLYDDTTDPYFYLRVHEDADGLYAVFGGEDHKTGQETDTEACYSRLEDALRRLLHGRRWNDAGPAKSSKRTTACLSSAKSPGINTRRRATPATD